MSSTSGCAIALLQAVDVGAPEAARSGAVHDLDAAGILARERVGDRARAVRRSVVDDQHAEARVREHAAREDRQVVALVVRRDDDEDSRWRVTIARAAGQRGGSRRSAPDRSRESGTAPAERTRGRRGSTDAGQQPAATRAGCRAAPEPSRARDRERQHEQIRHDRRQHDIWRSVAHTTARPARSCRTPCERAGAPSRAGARGIQRARRDSRAAPALRRSGPDARRGTASSARLSSGLAARSPSPRASGWLPVQNVTPPSEAIEHEPVVDAEVPHRPRRDDAAADGNERRDRAAESRAPTQRARRPPAAGRGASPAA